MSKISTTSHNKVSSYTDHPSQPGGGVQCPVLLMSEPDSSARLQRCTEVLSRDPDVSLHSTLPDQATHCRTHGPLPGCSTDASGGHETGVHFFFIGASIAHIKGREQASRWLVDDFHRMFESETRISQWLKAKLADDEAARVLGTIFHDIQRGGFDEYYRGSWAAFNEKLDHEFERAKTTDALSSTEASEFKKTSSPQQSMMAA